MYKINMGLCGKKGTVMDTKNITAPAMTLDEFVDWVCETRSNGFILKHAVKEFRDAVAEEKRLWDEGLREENREQQQKAFQKEAFARGIIYGLDVCGLIGSTDFHALMDELEEIADTVDYTGERSKIGSKGAIE